MMQLLSRILPLLLSSYFALPSALAIGIDKVTLHSNLGEPLFAQVDLQIGAEESVDDSCIFLTVADDIAENSIPPQTLRNLTVKLSADKQKIDIRSRNAFNEPYAIFRLRVQCNGWGSISKTITLLPEVADASTQAVHPDTTIETATVAGQNVTPAPAAAPTIIHGADDRGKTVTARPPERTALPVAREQTVNKPRNKNSSKLSHRKKRELQFQLTLAGEPLDLTRIGTLTPENIEKLRARQKLMDEDDQTASFMTMQHQLKLMQEELASIRLKLAQLQGSASAVSTASASPISNPVAPPETKTVKSQSWRSLVPTEAIVAAIALVVLGLFWIAKRKARHYPSETTATAGVEPIIIQPPEQNAPPLVPIKQDGNSPIEQKPSAPARDIDIQVKSGKEKEVELLEEAELYVIYGHSDKAIKMLAEYVGHHPSSDNAWVLLFSIYSSCGQSQEFEAAARKFRRLNKSSAAWKTVQALGRTVDNDHPLYSDETNPTESAPWLPSPIHRPRRHIGDILVELGHISPEDMRNCLSEFDPKLHGRFGNYLLTKRLISHAQINDALLIQQEINSTSKLNSELPSLQQVEHMLSGFDPAKDGSVEDFLMAHQKDGLMRFEQDINENPPPAPEWDTNPAPSLAEDKPHTLEFILNLDPPPPATATPPTAADKFTPLEFTPQIKPTTTP